MVEFEDFPDPMLGSAGNDGERQIGTVYVEFGTESLSSRKRELIGDGLLILLAGLVAAAAIALRMARGFSEPLQRLIAGVGAMGEGRLDARVPERSAGELAILERGFNDMAGRLQELHETMQRRIDDATAQLAFQARHDPLTGLINRREFERLVEEALHAAKAGKGRSVLCYLDLDRFKIINDTCGHVAGDELLRQLAHLLQHRVREGDVLGRLGGDEFGILLADCDEEDALGVVESLRRLVEDYRFGWHEHVFVVGASIGMVVVDAEATGIADLLSLADQACYLAKEKGRNRIQVCRRDDREFLARRGEMNWAERVSRAIEEDRLFFAAQRIHRCAGDEDGEVFAELQLRLRDVNGDTVLPCVFLPAAERFELVGAIDRWAVAAACRAVARFAERNAGRQLLALVSLSGSDADAERLLPWIEAQVAASGIAPENLCFGIDEAAASIRLADTMQLVQGLRRIGCRFCLENFGSGFASFSYLRHMPPDFVKIGAAIVRDIATDHVSRTVAQAIREMGRELGFKVIAEAVDDGIAFSILRSYGIELGQGSWFEAPLAFDLWIEHAAEAAEEAPRPAAPPARRRGDLS
jgi:diguanylate cyclase (GGDEF)-like protein